MGRSVGRLTAPSRIDAGFRAKAARLASPPGNPGHRRTTIARPDPVRPFLIAKDDDGQYRLTVRETRYNSQGYPIVTATLQDEAFKTATAARAHAKEAFGAEAGQFAAK